MERFELKIPVMIAPRELHGRSERVWLLSQNLSGTGGFFSTSQPLPVKSKVWLGLVMDLDQSKTKDAERYALIDAVGTVLRVEKEGMAVKFDRQFKILPIEGYQE